MRPTLALALLAVGCGGESEPFTFPYDPFSSAAIEISRTENEIHFTLRASDPTETLLIAFDGGPNLIDIGLKDSSGYLWYGDSYAEALAIGYRAVMITAQRDGTKRLVWALTSRGPQNGKHFYWDAL